MKVSLTVLGILIIGFQVGAQPKVVGTSGGGNSIEGEFILGARKIVSENPHYMNARASADLGAYSTISKKLKIVTHDPKLAKNVIYKVDSETLCKADRSITGITKFLNQAVDVNTERAEVYIARAAWNQASPEVKELAEAFALMKLNNASDEKIVRMAESYMKSNSVCDAKPDTKAAPKAKSGSEGATH